LGFASPSLEARFENTWTKEFVSHPINHPPGFAVFPERLEALCSGTY